MVTPMDSSERINRRRCTWQGCWYAANPTKVDKPCRGNGCNLLDADEIYAVGCQGQPLRWFEEDNASSDDATAITVAFAVVVFMGWMVGLMIFFILKAYGVL